MTSRIKANNLLNIREDINHDLLDCYNLILSYTKNKTNVKPSTENINFIIKKHKKFIDMTNIQGKSKYNTLNLLIHYSNTYDPSLAMSTLTNSLNNRKIFNDNKC